MAKVLITGATGNIGREIISALGRLDHHLDIYAGVRRLDIDKSKLSDFKVNFLLFDFADPTTFKGALKGCEILFLMRPPQISQAKKYFEPIIAACRESGVRHIVFLSVQGAGESKMIPHHKIEKLIAASQIPYTFLRPAYFMQNFLTALHDDLVCRKRIYLPAGNAEFTLIDVRDIGAAAAQILTSISQHANKSYELTSLEKLTFSQMANSLTSRLGTPIRYISPNLISFMLTKRKEKIPPMLIMVMIFLHYLPRFKKAPGTTDCVEKITGIKPKSFEEFIKDYRRELSN